MAQEQWKSGESDQNEAASRELSPWLQVRLNKRIQPSARPFPARRSLSRTGGVLVSRAASKIPLSDSFSLINHRPFSISSVWRKMDLLLTGRRRQSRVTGSGVKRERQYSDLLQRRADLPWQKPANSEADSPPAETQGSLPPSGEDRNAGTQPSSVQAKRIRLTGHSLTEISRAASPEDASEKPGAVNRISAVQGKHINVPEVQKAAESPFIGKEAASDRISEAARGGPESIQRIIKPGSENSRVDQKPEIISRQVLERVEPSSATRNDIQDSGPKQVLSDTGTPLAVPGPISRPPASSGPRSKIDRSVQADSETSETDRNQEEISDSESRRSLVDIKTATPSSLGQVGSEGRLSPSPIKGEGMESWDTPAGHRAEHTSVSGPVVPVNESKQPASTGQHLKISRSIQPVSESSEADKMLEVKSITNGEPEESMIASGIEMSDSESGRRLAGTRTPKSLPNPTPDSSPVQAAPSSLGQVGSEGRLSPSPIEGEGIERFGRQAIQRAPSEPAAANVSDRPVNPESGQVSRQNSSDEIRPETGDTVTARSAAASESPIIMADSKQEFPNPEGRAFKSAASSTTEHQIIARKASADTRPVGSDVRETAQMTSPQSNLIARMERPGTSEAKTNSRVYFNETQGPVSRANPGAEREISVDAVEKVSNDRGSESSISAGKAPTQNFTEARRSLFSGMPVQRKIKPAVFLPISGGGKNSSSLSSSISRSSGGNQSVYPAIPDLPVANSGRTKTNAGVTDNGNIFRSTSDVNAQSVFSENSHTPVQRSISMNQPANNLAVPAPAAEKEQSMSAQDLKKLARDVYPLIKRMIMVDKERMPG